MVYKSYKTNVENGTVYDVMDVIAVELHGNHMEHFLRRWDKVMLGLSEPMPENTKGILRLCGEELPSISKIIYRL